MTLDLSAPADGGMLRAETVAVRGTVAPAGAVVFVAGEPAKVAGGTFTATVSLQPGGNVIDVTASSPGPGIIAEFKRASPSAGVIRSDVEPGDLPTFFEHQRDPVAVALVVFRSREKAEFDEHWAKILADDTSLKKTIVADGQVAGYITSFVRDGECEVGYWIEAGTGSADAAIGSALHRLSRHRDFFGH